MKATQTPILSSRQSQERWYFGILLTEQQVLYISRFLVTLYDDRRTIQQRVIVVVDIDAEFLAQSLSAKSARKWALVLTATGPSSSDLVSMYAFTRERDKRPSIGRTAAGIHRHNPSNSLRLVTRSGTLSKYLDYYQVGGG
jgi:hypothetical protein